jgi:hypothetical protein
VIYLVKDRYFDAHSNYKTQLKNYSKKSFDPFRRNNRLTLPIENERYITTVGQLCFFKWCLTNHVLDYVEANITAIIEDMKKNTGKNDIYGGNDNFKKNTKSRRRSDLNVIATRVTGSPGQTTILVVFD